MGHNLFYTIVVLVIKVYIVIGYSYTENQEFDYEEIPTFQISPRSDNNDKRGNTDLDLQREFLRVFKKDVQYSNSDRENSNKAPEKDNQNFAFTKIGPKDFFFDNNQTNRNAIKEIKNLLLRQSSIRDTLDVALKYRDEINLSLWLSGYIGAIVNRKGRLSPFVPLVELKPDLMISSRAISEAKIESQKPQNQRTCVVAVNKESGKANGIENELWYFREDMMVNSHHWYWHLIYPNGIDVLLDRQGELFYYLHHSMLARYHSERLSNNLVSPVQTLDIKPNGIIKEPYYSLLEDSNSGLKWQDRPPNTVFSNSLPVVRNKNWGDRLFTAATNGFLIDGSSSGLDLKNFQGVDTLSRTSESQEYFSINRDYYGDWHNTGHDLISRIFGQFIGVMGHTATVMRDVVFYRWHGTVNTLYTKHKEILKPYSPRGGELQLAWPGVFVEDIKVNTVGRKGTPPPPNTLYTFWFQRRFDLSKGLDFQRDANINGPVDLCVDHLNHDDFNYTITVVKSPRLIDNTKATVRIFLAPRFDLLNRRYSMEEQRLFFFVLDTFSVDLKVGRNVITQSSKKSSLTLEFAKSLNQLEIDDFNERPQCGCGWPHHLLLPKGKSSGMTFDLFAKVTNGDEDAVISDSPDNSNTCLQGYLLCGRINDKYPDAKPMGYPFDRKPYTVADINGRRPVRDLDEYMSTIPNMNAVQVNIIHEPNRKES